jgi:hypothetical protein
MATPLPEKDHRITLDDAIKLVAARRTADSGKRDAERVFAFHRLGLDAVLGQKGCVGLRAYPAQHDDGSNTWVVVGVDDQGNDITDICLQEPFWCPPFCSDTALG